MILRQEEPLHISNWSRARENGRAGVESRNLEAHQTSVDDGEGRGPVRLLTRIPGAAAILVDS
jgi:hypothetical protein